MASRIAVPVVVTLQTAKGSKPAEGFSSTLTGIFIVEVCGPDEPWWWGWILKGNKYLISIMGRDRTFGILTCQQLLYYLCWTTRVLQRMFLPPPHGQIYVTDTCNCYIWAQGNSQRPFYKPYLCLSDITGCVSVVQTDLLLIRLRVLGRVHRIIFNAKASCQLLYWPLIASAYFTCDCDITNYHKLSETITHKTYQRRPGWW